MDLDRAALLDMDPETLRGTVARVSAAITFIMLHLLAWYLDAQLDATPVE